MNAAAELLYRTYEAEKTKLHLRLAMGEKLNLEVEMAKVIERLGL